MADLTVVRHVDGMLSVYAGTPHLGLIFPPITGGSRGYDARPSAPFCEASPDRVFDAERDAIDYLADAAGIER